MLARLHPRKANCRILASISRRNTPKGVAQPIPKNSQAYARDLQAIARTDMRISSPKNSYRHPHLLYPQFKQVAHPSIRMTAFVLHLWHIVAPRGKAPADSASDDSSFSWRPDSPILPARSAAISAAAFVETLLPRGLISDFFFAPA